jgi:molybdenum cofactor biosynthesis enzyme MoaA
VNTRIYHVTLAPDFGSIALFFWGCNLSCRVCLLQKEAFDCHLEENRRRLYDPKHKSLGPESFLSLESLIRLVDPLPCRQAVLMGAEPVCDPALDRVLDHLKTVKNAEVVLLTNGKTFPPVDMLDAVVFSIKAVTPALHADYTGSDNARILENFRLLAERDRPALSVETVFVPGYVDEKEVMKIAEAVAEVDPALPLRIDAYLPMPGLPWRAPTEAEIRGLAERVRSVLPNTTWLHGRAGELPLAYGVKRVF